MTRIAPFVLIGLLATAGHGQASACSPAHPLTCSSPDPAAARVQIESALRQMTAAVLAGDPEAYLRHVWKGEPNWAKEQENWAADLTRHFPGEFTFELRGDPAVSDGWAEADARMSWRIAAGDHRSVDFAARFAEGDGCWLYAGEKWEVLEGDKVRVMYPPDLEGPAGVVAEELPAVRTRVHEGFELGADDIIERVQQVKLYASMEHLQQSIYLSYEEPLGGWNEPGEAIKLLGRAVRRRGSARTLLAHEYGHVATFELGDKAPKMPWWVLEGVAEVSAEALTGGRPDGLVKTWAQNGELIAWDRLADFRGEARDHVMHVYKQGQHMVGYVSERWGRAGRNAWLTRMAQGATLDEATKEALGLPFEELDRQWRESLDGDGG